MKWKVQLDNSKNNTLIITKNSSQELLITESLKEQELCILIEENACLLIKQNYTNNKPVSLRLIITLKKNAQVLHELFVKTTSSISCDYEFILFEVGSMVKSYGLIHGIKDSSSFVRVKQIHQAMNTESLVSFKTVLDDEALYDYQGTIIIAKHAFNTKAEQQDRVLLVNDGATASSVPSLQVDCNAVKCSHASAIFCINDDQLTMLAYRGITKKEAKKLIIAGFLKH